MAKNRRLNFNWKSMRLVKEANAVWVEDKYVYEGCNYKNKTVAVNKVSIYLKPNGKTITIVHHFRKEFKVPEHFFRSYTKERQGNNGDWCVSERYYTYETTHYTIKDEYKDEVIKMYFNRSD